MQTNPQPILLDPDLAKATDLKVGKVFTPRTPVSTHALFAGRWDEMKQIVDIVSQVGLHAVLYGERGVGKTSLANVIPFILAYFDRDADPPRESPRITLRVNANTTDTFSSVWIKVFEGITWHEDAPSIGFKPVPGVSLVTLRDAFALGPSLTIEDVRRVLSTLPDSVFVIDEFDRLPSGEACQFTDLIKALADGSTPSTVIIVGVAETVDQLVRDHASITRALIQIPLERMEIKELLTIIEKAEKELGIVFDKSAGDTIAMMSQGLPHYTHLVGQFSTRAALKRLSGVVTPEDVSEGFERAVDAADQTISKQYSVAVTSAQPAALYGHALLACAVAAARESDSHGYFQPVSVVDPLTAILRRDESIPISTFNKHLVEFCDEKRGRVLERTGRTKSFRYRFRDPLMPPYVLMRGIADKLIDSSDLAAFMQESST